jgi:hypothetical protein
VPWLADRLSIPRDELLGTADVAARLGVTRQRVAQLRRDDPTFPRNFSGYGHAKAWRTAGIEIWAAAHRPNRPEAGGRFVGEAASLLLAAEVHAQRLNLHWIDSGLFWLALAAGESGCALAAAMESMGMTAQEIEVEVLRWRGTDDAPKQTRRMNPRVQSFLAAANRLAGQQRRKRIRTVDILLAFIDAKPIRVAGLAPRPPDHLLSAFQRRGLDISELRRRLVSANAEPASVAAFESVRLRPWRSRLRKKPAWLDLARNPLGHDPWTRRPWGTVFGRTRDERGLKVDGEQWFFSIDGDGFFVRTADGRPVGYRYRLEPKPRMKPTNGFMEILPMPPVEMADWPDRRYERDD